MLGQREPAPRHVPARRAASAAHCMVGDMAQSRIDDVIATRELWLTTDAGGQQLVEVRIGRPRPGVAADDPTAMAHGDYVCEFQIEGIGTGGVRRACGVDAMQALVLALEQIGMYLAASDEARAGRLTWLDPTSLNFGFPVLPR